MRFIFPAFAVIALAAIVSNVSAQIVEVSPDSLEFGDVVVEDFGLQMLTVANVSQGGINCRIEVSDAAHFRAQTRMREVMEARAVLFAISNAALRYRQVFGEDPSSVEQLIEYQFINLDYWFSLQWWFSFIGSNPISFVAAVSSDSMPGGAGHFVVYNLQTGQFSGYGEPSDVDFYLGPGRNQTLPVTFLPEDTEEYAGNLTLFVSYYRQRENELLDSLTIKMHGIGRERESSEFIEISPESLDFGDASIGDSAELDLTVTNISQENAMWCTVQSNDIAHFRILDPEALDARATLLAIYDAALQFRQDHGEDPYSVEQLEQEHYLVIEEEVAMRWTFQLIGSNPIYYIEASSTAVMQGGAGHVIVYDVQSGDFEGYDSLGEYNIFGLEIDHGFRTLVRFVPDEDRDYERIISILVGRWPDYAVLDRQSVVLQGSGAPVAVSENPVGAIPAGFCLFPAYPNPFNSRATIRFALPEAGLVKLTLYALTGRVAAQLANGRFEVGWHSAALDAGALPAGVYLARLEAGRIVRVTKAVVVK